MVSIEDLPQENPTSGQALPLAKSSGSLSESTNSRAKELPVELLANILTLWASIDEDGPWMAAAVCQHWRKVVLDSNEAWGYITVRLEPEPESDTTWCIEEDELERIHSPRGKRRPVGLWIERARDAELSLHVATQPTFPMLDLALGKELLLFSDCIRSLRQLSLSVESGYLAGSILEVLCSGARKHRLDHLEINVAFERRVPKSLRAGNPEGLTLEDIWGFTPVATHLTFRGCLPPSPSERAHHVRSLVLENSEVNFTSTLLPFPCIQFLDLSCGSSKIPGGLPPVSPLRITSHHSLEELRIHDVPTGHCAKLLDSLHTPSLKRLTVGNFGAPELRTLWNKYGDMKWYDLMDVFGSAVAAFAEKTPSLEAVRLVKSPIDDRHFVGVLQSLQGIRELYLDTLLIGLPAMRGLTPALTGKGKDKPVLCPCLQYLHIRSCDSIQLQHLVSLLQARNHPASQCLPILEVEINECKNFQAEDAMSLSNIDPRRLRVTVL